MLTARDVYKPENLLVDASVNKNGKNLDSELLGAFHQAEDTLILVLQRVLKTRKVSKVDNRTLAPLFSSGLISRDLLEAFNRLSFYASVIRERRKRLPEALPGRDRYRRAKEPDGRMPGSALPLNQAQMKLLIKQAKSLEKKLGRIKTK